MTRYDLLSPRKGKDDKVRAYPRLQPGSDELRKYLSDRVDVDQATGCWNWTRFRDGNGYGRGCVQNTLFKANRAAWIAFKGPLFDEHVLHRCHNRACINPDHLYLGDHAQNMRDMADAGRVYRKTGAKNHNSKLTEATVREIRASRQSGHALAKVYGASPTAINLARSGATWSHVQ